MNRLRIIRTSALTEFANLVSVYRRDLYKLWMISPWIGEHPQNELDPLQILVDAVREAGHCMVNVVTRPPAEDASYHRNALQLLRANIRPLIFYCSNLHTKLYILQANGFHCAVMGSPNFTARGNTANIELAIEIRDSGLRRHDEISFILEELVRYGDDLLHEPQVELVS